jgi:hypothetical protein
MKVEQEAMAYALWDDNYYYYITVIIIIIIIIIITIIIIIIIIIGKQMKLGFFEEATSKQISEHNRQRTYNVIMWPVRVIFLPPRLP